MIHERIVNKLEHIVKNKHATKKIAIWKGKLHALNKRIVHVEEFIVVGVIVLSSVLLANMTGLSANDPRNAEIASSLQAAINQVQPWAESKSIISQRQVDSTVENTFYKGYCTYGAALISPEFFPYTSPLTQGRTRWGNAADRYLNAQIAWFSVGAEPRTGAFVIYKKGGRFVNAGHVGKVLKYFPEYGKMIVRDMNRVGRGIMSDRREYKNNENILWYIYQKQWAVVQNPERVDKNATIEPDIAKADVELVLNLPVLPEEKKPNPIVEVTPTPVEPIAHPVPIDYRVDVDVVNMSLEAQHFLSQRDIRIQTDINYMRVWDKKNIEILITNKQDGTKFSGILPSSINFVTSSSVISVDYSTLQLVFDGKASVQVQANKAGVWALLINLWEKELYKIKAQVE